MTSILIIAGEDSGDIHGADLIHEFKKRYRNDVIFFGIGGLQMKKEGVRLLYPAKDLAVVGLFEVLGQLVRIKKIFNRIVRETEREKPSVAVLIDSPDFNLRLAKRIKKRGIPILYYISPTVWIWRSGRLKTIKKNVDRMLLIFPFEKDIYRRHQIPAVYVGHPLVHKLAVPLGRDEFFKKHELDSRKKTICVLPGSRKSEILYHMPILLQSIDRISRKYEIQFLIVQAQSLENQFFNGQISGCSSPLTVIREDRYSAMRHSDAAVSSCGTANLELAILETPFIAFYRLTRLTYHLGIHLLKMRNYSIVNILSGKTVVKELIQHQFTVENVIEEVGKLLESKHVREEMISDFRKIKDSLGDKRASVNAAEELKSLLESSK